MMDASTSSTDLLNRLQLVGFQKPEGAQLPDADRELSAPSTEYKGLWTDGLPDKDKIKQRMEALLQSYMKQEPPRIESGRFRYERYFTELHRREREFYGEMHYLDDLLHAAPVLSLPAESTTTIVPYQPAPKRRRGRPATGIKPRDRRVNRDDDSF